MVSIVVASAEEELSILVRNAGGNGHVTKKRGGMYDVLIHGHDDHMQFYNDFAIYFIVCP